MTEPKRGLLPTLAVSYLGCGLFPVAPGTVGTAGAAVTAWLLLGYLPVATTHWWALALVMALLASVATIVFTPHIETTLGKDPGIVVTDEVAGYFVTLLAVPGPEFQHLVAAFFVFRVMDILKPWPASALERLPGGWGVLLDDVMAGLYGAVVMGLVTWV